MKPNEKSGSNFTNCPNCPGRRYNLLQFFSGELGGLSVLFLREDDKRAEARALIGGALLRGL
jgi:hypothetical protein